jgi:hypothetical protein
VSQGKLLRAFRFWAAQGVNEKTLGKEAAAGHLEKQASMTFCSMERDSRPARALDNACKK